jgi:hypothetical protein
MEFFTHRIESVIESKCQAFAEDLRLTVDCKLILLFRIINISKISLRLFETINIYIGKCPSFAQKMTVCTCII